METEQLSWYYRLKSTSVILLSLYALCRIAGRFYKTYRVRARYQNIPSFPRHPIWGNLINAGPHFSPMLNRHPDYGFEEMWQQLGQPGCFLLDVTPVQKKGHLILAAPQFAEKLAQPLDEFKYSLPKDPDSSKLLKPLMGAEGINAQEGSHWRAIRKRFNPGFQPQHLQSLSGQVAAKVRLFVHRLEEAAKAGAIFRMSDYARDLTFDVVTQIGIGKDLAAQTTPESQGDKSSLGVITLSRRLSELIYGKGHLLGLTMLDPVRPTKLFIYERIYNQKLTAIVKDCIDTVSTSSVEDRSITQLAASDLRPDEALVRNCMHQVKSFIFAGQDSTGTLIQWLCYEMSKSRHDSRNADSLKRLRQEHDAVFGPDRFSALDVFSSSMNESLSLPYTTAFIKETLRLHPPAGSARFVPWDKTSTTLSLPEGDVCIAGLNIYICHYLIHRNQKVWGPDAHIFNPERWLDEAYVARLPPGAYRPFERGPRNCIGQELAMMEATMVLCAVARAFMFEKVGLTGQTDGVGRVEKEVWNKLAVTSVPVDGMVMRVSRVDA